MADPGNMDEDVAAVDEGFVLIEGETHVLNYDTNILNLDDDREVTPGAELDMDDDMPTGTDSVDEEGDIEVCNFEILCITSHLTFS